MTTDEEMKALLARVRARSAARYSAMLAEDAPAKMDIKSADRIAGIEETLREIKQTLVRIEGAVRQILSWPVR